MNMECVVKECPVQHRCGYLIAGTPCMHPEWRDKWRQKMAEKEKQEKEDNEG